LRSWRWTQGEAGALRKAENDQALGRYTSLRDTVGETRQNAECRTETRFVPVDRLQK
jgi:hypothetical protein